MCACWSRNGTRMTQIWRLRRIIIRTNLSNPIYPCSIIRTFPHLHIYTFAHLVYLSNVKQFLNRKLTVKQIFALILLPIAVMGTAYIFTTGDRPPAPLMIPAKRDSSGKMVAARDTSALGRLKAYVDSINSSDFLRGGSWSFYLADADSGKPVVAVDIDRGLMRS